MKTYFNHQKRKDMKTTNKRKQEQADSCKAGILKKPCIVTGPNGQAYLRPEYHDRISRQYGARYTEQIENSKKVRL